MSAPEECSVRVNGLRLHLLTWGTPGRPPVVLLHGGSAHAHWWDFVAADLAHHYRLLAPDLRGHGDSEHADPRCYALDDYVHDLEGLVRECGLTRFALVGHSLGAYIALRFTAAHRRLVQCLIVVDVGPRSGRGRRARFLSRLQHLPHPRFADAEDAARRFRLLPSATSAPAEVLRHVALKGMRSLPDGGLTFKFDRAAFAHYDGLDLSSSIAELECPTLFIRGSESAFVDGPTLARMAAHCPGADTAEIEGAHHHVMLDRPAALAARIASFLVDHHVNR